MEQRIDIQRPSEISLSFSYRRFQVGLSFDRYGQSVNTGLGCRGAT
jgi:hypothetical protein